MPSRVSSSSELGEILARHVSVDEEKGWPSAARRPVDT
jgi:hypothetical protein